jgi:hypothetical protein
MGAGFVRSFQFWNFESIENHFICNTDAANIADIADIADIANQEHWKQESTGPSLVVKKCPLNILTTRDSKLGVFRPDYRSLIQEFRGIEDCLISFFRFMPSFVWGKPAYPANLGSSFESD